MTGVRWLTVFLDFPAGSFGARAFEREVSFWSALTGWELQTGARSESACLDRPAGIPVRILAALPHETIMADPAGRPYCLTIRW